ncbi:endonuclease III [Anaerobiospirillum succiniciproducens]|uniref:endonuclease III n=1 Tax=Anaerobiospirillum succiniciproducens TaxID=13335 RepID=UPI003F89A082
MAASAKKESKVKEQDGKKPAKRGCCRKAASAADKKPKDQAMEVKTKVATKTASKSACKSKSSACKSKAKTEATEKVVSTKVKTASKSKASVAKTEVAKASKSAKPKATAEKAAATSKAKVTPKAAAATSTKAKAKASEAKETKSKATKATSTKAKAADSQASKTKATAIKSTAAKTKATATKAATKSTATKIMATASKAATKSTAAKAKATATKTATKSTAAKSAAAKSKAVKAEASKVAKSAKASAPKVKAVKASAAKETKEKAVKANASASKDTKETKIKATIASSKAAKAKNSTTKASTAKSAAKNAASGAKAKAEEKVVVKASMADAKKINRKMLAPVDSKREIVRKAEPSKGVEKEFADITLLNKEERFEVMRLLEEQNPNPKSELNFNNSFELLCAVVLSAQATDESVNKATPALFKAAPDAKSMAALGADGIAPYIQSIGLWKNKAKFLEKLSKELDEKYDGKVPETMEELIALPGVGSKTAKVVLNVAFGKPYLAVDTHVFRVCSRIGLCLGHCPGDVENKIPPLIDERFMKEAHHYLLLHGRYNCTARKFEDHCAKCVVAKYCKHNY